MIDGGEELMSLMSKCTIKEKRLSEKFIGQSRVTKVKNQREEGIRIEHCRKAKSTERWR